MAKDLKKIEYAQERNALSHDIKSIRGLKKIDQEHKDLLIRGLLENGLLSQRNDIQLVIDNYFSSADHYIYDDSRGSRSTKCMETDMAGKFNENTTQSFLDNLLRNFDPEQLKKGNNVYGLNSHGFGCPACGGLIQSMMFVELAIKTNNMVIIFDGPDDRTYVTSNGVISYIDGKIYSGSYDKVGLLPMIFLDGRNARDVMKKISGKSSITELSYDKMKPILALEKQLIRHSAHADGDKETITYESVLRCNDSFRALGLTEENLKNITYSPK